MRHPHHGVDSLQVVSDLLGQKDILVIPGTAFTPTDEAMLRLSFANLSEPEINELAVRLAE